METIMDFSKMTFHEVIEEVLSAQLTGKMSGRIIADLELSLIDCDGENRLWADYLYKKKENHLNPYDGVHGGIACTIADTCMGNTICAATQSLPSTTDLSVSYLKPMNADSFRIHVEIRKTGKQLVAANCSIYELESGRLCVDSMSKYILVKKDILADEEASSRMDSAICPRGYSHE